MATSPGLAEEQRRALDRLSEAPGLPDFYLAGGTAIAIHCGHRRSLDLDLFSLRPDVDLESTVQLIAAKFMSCEVVSRSDALAGLRDLGVMKFAAIARRGIRRDFWDLFAILNLGEYTLRSLAADYLCKFGVRESDLYHVLKALTYFDDAERDPALPQGMTLELWQDIKTFFRTHAPELVD